MQTVTSFNSVTSVFWQYSCLFKKKKSITKLLHQSQSMKVNSVSRKMLNICKMSRVQNWNKDNMPDRSSRLPLISIISASPLRTKQNLVKRQTIYNSMILLYFFGHKFLHKSPIWSRLICSGYFWPWPIRHGDESDLESRPPATYMHLWHWKLTPHWVDSSHNTRWYPVDEWGHEVILDLSTGPLFLYAPGLGRCVYLPQCCEGLVYGWM